MRNVLTTPTRTAGTVKWFYEPQGFGYIDRDDGGPDCFVHRFDFRGGDFRTLTAGERVEFAVVDRQNGPWADDVMRLPHQARCASGTDAPSMLSDVMTHNGDLHGHARPPTRGRSPNLEEVDMRTARRYTNAAGWPGAVVPITGARPGRTSAPSLRILSVGECEALLTRNAVGRIAFAHRGCVNIFPANYVYADGWLYARADFALGMAIAHNGWVAVEVAEVRSVSDWQSVVVRGACYATSPNKFVPGDAAMAAGVALLRDRVPEMSREGETMPISTAIFRVHADEIIGCRAASSAVATEPVRIVRPARPRSSLPMTLRRNQ
jgi:cold shock CspA family protein/nitroimidazol reductase NimA-like FMN-containing flavoprotein (pyridoxamine 5'-phosphate oxidase superfamily)